MATNGKKTNYVTVNMQADTGEVSAITCNVKTFKTGSRGFYGNGKVELSGIRYQVQISLIEIGSSPTSPFNPKNKAK